MAARPTYVAYGPVFETSTKKDPDPVVGIVGLREAYKRAAVAGVSLVAIGGITRQRASALVGIADAVAVVGELLPPARAFGHRPASEWLGEVTARASALGSLFACGPSQAGAA
jgi:thiamine-phosphate pyrophosphorylase